MLERIRPPVAVLTAHIPTAIDLVQMVVIGGTATITYEPLHLVVEGDGHVLCSGIRDEIRHQRCRRWLNAYIITIRLERKIANNKCLDET